MYPVSDLRASEKTIGEERRFQPEEIGVVDMLQVLEGLAYVGFIAGAIFAVWELRTMSRDRQTEFILRVNEFWSTKDFQDAYAKVQQLNSQDPKEIEEICTRQSLNIVAGYLDGVGDLARRKLLKKDLVLDVAAWDILWNRLLPWIDSERNRSGNVLAFYGFEYVADESRKWRVAWEQSQRTTSGAR